MLLMLEDAYCELETKLNASEIKVIRLRADQPN